jgi:hypothetical protein
LTEKASTNETLLDLYQRYLPRLIEEKMLDSICQGKVSKWFRIGKKLVCSGVTAILDNHILRIEIGVFTDVIFITFAISQWQVKPTVLRKAEIEVFILNATI